MFKELILDTFEKAKKITGHTEYGKLAAYIQRQMTIRLDTCVSAKQLKRYYEKIQRDEEIEIRVETANLLALYLDYNDHEDYFFKKYNKKIDVFINSKVEKYFKPKGTINIDMR